MSCNHCVAAVKKELSRIDGVVSADVAIGSATVTYDELKTGPEQLRAAVADAGYTPA